MTDFTADDARQLAELTNKKRQADHDDAEAARLAKQAKLAPIAGLLDAASVTALAAAARGVAVALGDDPDAVRLNRIASILQNDGAAIAGAVVNANTPTPDPVLVEVPA